MGKDKAILFVGYKHKTDSIQSAKEFGYKVVLATRKAGKGVYDMFDEVIEKDILLKENVNSIMKYLKEKYSIKAIISNYEDYVVQRSYFAEYFGLPCTSVYSACCSRNKVMQRQALGLMKENINYRIIHTQKEAENAFKKFGSDIYLKSIAGIKSQYIFHICSLTELENAFFLLSTFDLHISEDLYSNFSYYEFNFHYPDPKTTFLVERAVYGQEVTVESFVGRYKISHAPSICDAYPAAKIDIDDSFIAFRILPSKQPTAIIERCYEVVRTAMKVLGLQYCASHAQLIVTKEGDIKIIELASRIGGYRPLMYREVYNLDIPKFLIQASINEPLRIEGSPSKYISMMEIFSRKNGILVKVQGLNELYKDTCVSYIEIHKEKGENVGLAKEGNKKVLTFLISGESYEEVYEKSLYYQKKLVVKTQ